MVENFVANNLTNDSTVFRQQFMKDFTCIMIRCRDFLVQQEKRQRIGENEIQIMMKLDNLLVFIFINLCPGKEWEWSNNIKNLCFALLGSNYQRLRFCLEVLHIFTDCLFQYKHAGVNKGSNGGDPKNLFLYFRQLNVLNMYSSENLNRLLYCVRFYMNDIREMAGKLLICFEPSDDQLNRVAEKGNEL